MAIPIILAAGFTVGYLFDTTFLKDYILIATFLMIYPTMIGFKVKEAFDLSHFRLLITAMFINFAVIPALAYGLGRGLLDSEPQMFAGLALASLLPTSGMTISWTMIHKGNVPAAIKMTAVGLIAGSVLAPWYLLLMVGKIVPVNVVQIFTTIAVVVFLPLLLGNVTYNLLMKKYSPKEFQEKIKPVLPSVSIWAMLFVIFSSISMKAGMIISAPEVIMQGLTVLLVFYLLNFVISTVAGRALFVKPDSIALVYGTVMRNLSIALGVAVTTFGPKAGLIVTLAFIIQVQAAAWYGKIAEKFAFLKNEPVLKNQ
jgi:ACR3 family arsenite efflux pump ArsB